MKTQINTTIGILLLAGFAILSLTKTAAAQSYQVTVTSSDPGLNLKFLAEYAASGLSQRCAKQGLRFTASHPDGAIPLVIDVSSFKIDEDVNVVHGVNITEYLAICDLQGCVQASPPSDGKGVPRIPFQQAGSAVKRKEGTETFQSPTAALDEILAFNSMFGKSLAGRVFDSALQKISEVLSPEISKH